MSQPIAAEVWMRAVRDKDPKLLPNKKTRELFTGKTGTAINPDGGIVRQWDFSISRRIETYDDRRINGLSGQNTEGRDGWGASAFGTFQKVMFTSVAFGMSRIRSLAYRLYEQDQFSGEIGHFGDATKSARTSGGQRLLTVAQQISEVKTRVQEEVIGPDMDAYFMYIACNGKINGRVVAKPGHDAHIFDGDPDHYDWVAEPGPLGGISLPPKFAPICCMELDFENIFPMLENLRNAWTAVKIDHSKCIIAMDPDYRLRLTQILNGYGMPTTDAARKEMVDGVGDTYKLNGFTFDFNVDPRFFPYVYVDANNNVVHSADGKAAYDKYINGPDGIDPTDRNPFRTRLIASYRMGVQNYTETAWNPETAQFEEHVYNYPLGEISSAPYYGEVYETPYENLNTFYGYPGDDHGLPAKDEVPEGWEGKTATGPVGEITKRKVVGLAVYPPAVSLSQEFSEIRTDDGGVRGMFTEMVMSIKYDGWVQPQYSLGVVPIIDINDYIAPAIPVSIINGKSDVTVHAPEDAKLEVHATSEPVDVTVKNTADEPVYTSEVNKNTAKSTKKADK